MGSTKAVLHQAIEFLSCFRGQRRLLKALQGLESESDLSTVLAATAQAQADRNQPAATKSQVDSSVI